MKRKEYSKDIQTLASLHEKVLQIHIIEPLLRKLGFYEVRDTSGSIERGKDLIALKQDEFGNTVLTSIQIKRYEASAKAGDASSFGRLLDQLRQATEELVLDPSTNEMRPPDNCLFITPYPIPSQALNAFHQRTRDPVMRNIRIIDGPRLIDLISKHLPSALGHFSLESQYRLRIASELNSVPESVIAFELSKPVELHRIYIDADVSDGLRSLSHFAGARNKVSLTIHEASQIVEAGAKLNLGFVRELNRKITRARELSVDRIDVFPTKIMPELQPHMDSFADALPTLSKTESTESICTDIARKFILLQIIVTSLAAGKTVNKRKRRAALQTPSATPNVAYRIPSSALMKINENLYILGGPGSGKSTMLRWLARSLAAAHPDLLPVYIPLVTVKNSTESSLVDSYLQQCIGPEVKKISGSVKERLMGLLKAGKVRLCLDGLDEVGDRAETTMQAIKDFIAKYKKSKVILSCRNTFDFPKWAKAFPVHLQSFSNEQQISFISKWYSSQPSSRTELLKWIDDNERMKESARTPLIAALLCSLFEWGAEMPTTEVELYARRFDLLLGRWERAKEIVPLSQRMRHQYLSFLMAFAMHLQQSEKRTDLIDTALKFADRNIVRNSIMPATMVLDCIRRGVLEKQGTGEISFGHLTYQEFMASEWLCQRDASAMFLWSKLRSSWWLKTLEFYAAKKMDITHLIRFGLGFRGEGESMNAILRLSQLAPLTSSEAVALISRQPRTEEYALFPWDRQLRVKVL